MPSKKFNLHLEHQPEARVGPEPAYFGVPFWSLGFFGLILGRFRDAAFPIFLDFLLVPTITRTRCSLTPVMGDITEEMSG